MVARSPWQPAGGPLICAHPPAPSHPGDWMSAVCWRGSPRVTLLGASSAPALYFLRHIHSFRAGWGWGQVEGDMVKHLGSSPQRIHTTRRGTPGRGALLFGSTGAYHPTGDHLFHLQHTHCTCCIGEVREGVAGLYLPGLRGSFVNKCTEGNVGF